MSLVIDLPLPVENKIKLEAQKAGLPPEELVAKVVRQMFGPSVDSQGNSQSTDDSITLLQSWLAEACSPRTKEELADAEADMVELMRGLNAPRKEAGQRLHFPDISGQP